MHFRINSMMDRDVVEYHYRRMFIALLGELLDEFDGGATFDRRTRDVVSECVGAEVEDAEHRSAAMEARFDTMGEATR